MPIMRLNNNVVTKTITMFKEHPKYPTILIGEDGLIISKKTKQPMKVFSRNKDLVVQIHKMGHKKVKNLVSDVWLDNPHNLPCVIHEDNDLTNNHPSNLKRVEVDYYVNEDYKEHPEYKGYFSTPSGKIWSVHRGNGYTETMKEISQSYFKTGYLGFSISMKGKIKRVSSHRFIAQCWIPNPDNKSMVNHNDEVKDNNKVTNLEWSTNSENQMHSIKKLRRRLSHHWKILEVNTGKEILVEVLSEWCKENSINISSLKNTLYRNTIDHKGYILIKV